jgi:FlaG/FlaF family flagellin (archaellin)
MVAITVILAAVIGTFVLGLGENVESEVQAGVTVDGTEDSTSRNVTWTSQGTADKIVIRGAGDSASDISNVGGSTEVSSSGESSVVAVTDDGKETVVRTFTVSS